MDASSFDALARALATPGRAGRRTLLGAGVGLLLAGRRHDAAAACKKVGKKCDKNKDCCDGAKCKGGKNGKCRCKNGFTKCGKRCRDLDKHREHCGVCGNACVSPDACCDGVCSLTCAK